LLTIALDAMGSDRAPDPEVEGALAVARAGELEVLLVGDEPRLRAAIASRGSATAVRVHHASEVVAMDDHPARVFRAKPGSSMRVALERVKAGDAAAMVSAGNSGAVLTHAVFVLGRIAGVDRPGIVTVFPTPAGPLTLCDAGANVDVKPEMLRQFALLGAAYDRVVHGRARPRLGLLSNGGEPGKGTELTRAAHALLAAEPRDFEYLGYVEGSDLFDGRVDVVATDGFTGNVVLKAAEGLAAALCAEVRYEDTGGALLAGVDGVVTIAHGRSDATAIANALRCAARFAGAQLPARLAEAVGLVRESPS
jgi:glycerol-3-phosphate acyltransferase PlsX